MERNEFLSKLGIGVAAVCAGCALASCGGGSAGNSPSPGASAPVPGSGGTFLSADLSTELTAVGATKTGNGIILARVAAGNAVTAFTAVQIACTHEGTNIGYNTGQGIFICPLHGSQFDKNGAVLLGPAATNLKHYTVAIAGTALTVS